MSQLGWLPGESSHLAWLLTSLQEDRAAVLCCAVLCCAATCLAVPCCAVLRHTRGDLRLQANSASTDVVMHCMLQTPGWMVKVPLLLTGLAPHSSMLPPDTLQVIWITLRCLLTPTTLDKQFRSLKCCLLHWLCAILWTSFPYHSCSPRMLPTSVCAAMHGCSGCIG